MVVSFKMQFVVWVIFHVLLHRVPVKLSGTKPKLDTHFRWVNLVVVRSIAAVLVISRLG